MSDDDDDLFDTVSAMADRIRLTGKEKDRYIHEHMTRGGYRAVPQYVKDDQQDDDDKDDGGFFGRRSSNRDRSPDGPRGGRSTRRDDWYG